MKWVIFAMLFPFLSFAQNSKLDEKNGFEWFTFGTPPSNYNNLVLEIDEAGVRLYSCTQSFSNFEGVQFQDINVTFNKKKLSCISLKTKNATGLKFFDKLKEMFGEPKMSAVKRGDYEWQGNKVKLLYEHVSSNDGLITFYSKIIK